ncbi:MAG TPA: glycosyl hydrolase, partial [Chitinophagaceae bacterium]|nr:glycosyl hydrolase [Chitinophagaceae bacterium]
MPTLKSNDFRFAKKTKTIVYVFVLAFMHPLLIKAQQPARLSGFSVLQKGFETPPDSVKPFVYWYWLNDNISEEGVIKDIESMAEVGIGGAFIGNIGLERREGTDDGKIKLFTRDWRKITEAAIRTAAKKNIQIGLFNSPGWSQSGGPWIKPAHAMRYIASTEIYAEGPANLSVQIPAPDTSFQQVAVLAFPVPEKDREKISSLKPVVSADSIIEKIGNLVDGNNQSFAFLPKNTKAITLDIKTAASFTARSLTVYPASTTFRADIALQVKEENDFRTIRYFEMDRSNAMKNVGFIPFAPVTISFAPTTGKEFRLAITGISGDPGFAEIEISAAPRIERVAEKQLAKMFQTPLPLWNEYQWPRQTEPDLKSLVIDKTKVIDLSAFVSNEGKLNWKCPAGTWMIVRYGMIPTGVTNAPASPEGQGLDVDKMNKEAVALHFKSFVQPVYESIPLQYRKALKYVVADSYETGSQNWTEGLAADFRKKYKYDPLVWLPVLSGRIVSSADESNRFLWDMRRMVADRVASDYTGALRKESNKLGMKLWLENYGHWGFPAEFLQYGGQSDEVGGEFWAEGDLGSIEIKAASSAVNIYGKQRVWAESFTAAGQPFARYPALLKKRGDWAFTQGVNSTVLHVYISQPYADKKPGINTWFGTEFNRYNTWFTQGKAFIDYIRRCNFLLQQGKAVNDVAYFIGEDAPKMTGIRDPELPNGYSFDYINAEVIEKRVSVKNGKLVLPDGMSYRMLVLPKLETMRPALLQKIKKLVQEGAVILGPSPDRSPSLQNYPVADKDVQKIVAELWGDTRSDLPVVRKYGKGVVMNGLTMQQALDTLHVLPDFKTDKDQPVLYIHRKYKGYEIYFVT